MSEDAFLPGLASSLEDQRASVCRLIVEAQDKWLRASVLGERAFVEAQRQEIERLRGILRGLRVIDAPQQSAMF